MKNMRNPNSKYVFHLWGHYTETQTSGPDRKRKIYNYGAKATLASLLCMFNITTQSSLSKHGISLFAKIFTAEQGNSREHIVNFFPVGNIRSLLSIEIIHHTYHVLE